MSDGKSIRSLRIAAFAVAAVGLAFTAWVSGRTAERSRRMNEYAGHFQRLEDLHRTTGKREAAIRLFDTISDRHPAPVADLLKQTLSDRKYETSEQPAQPAVQGWTLRRAEVTFPDIALGDVAAFLATVETQRPPWRLTSCEIRASQTAGSGRVKLALEALEKTGASPVAMTAPGS